MDLLVLDRPDPREASPARTLEVAAGQARERVAPSSAAPQDAVVAAGLDRIYGPGGGADAGARLDAAVRAAGPSAVARFVADPGAFGALTGDPALAALVGPALLARDHIRQSGEPAPRATPAGPDDVRSAVDTIRASLTQTPTDRVTHADLMTADRALFALSPADATRAFRSLPEADVRQWAEELNDSPLLGPYRGLDGAEQDDFFARLASRLDGPQLARFAHALESNGSASPGGDGQRLGAAVARYAPAEVRASFVSEALPFVGVNRDLSTAAAEALGGLRGDSLESVLRGATPEQVRQLVGDAVLSRPVGASTAYDAGPAQRLLSALATTSDEGLKATAFVAADDALARLERLDRWSGAPADTVPRGQAARDLSAGMTALLGSQTNAVVEKLRSQADPDGTHLAHYIESRLDAGDLATVDGQIDRLRQGDQMDEDAATRFGADIVGDNGQPWNGNAARLGHYVGAVALAVIDRAEARREEGQRWADLVNIAVPTPLGNTASKYISAETLRAEAGAEVILQSVRESAYPLVPDGPDRNGDGQPEMRRYSGEGESDYKIAIDHVTNTRGRTPGGAP